MRVLVVTVAALWLATSAAQARTGSLDPGFSRDGRVAFSLGEDSVRPVAAVPDGHGGIYVLALAPHRWFLVRVGADGRLDRSFGNRGVVRYPAARIIDFGDVFDGNEMPTALALQPGRIPRLLAVGQAKANVVTIVAFTLDGSPDATFGVGGVWMGAVEGYAQVSSQVLVDPDGSVTVAATLRGDSRTYPYTSAAAVSLMRVAADGRSATQVTVPATTSPYFNSVGLGRGRDGRPVAFFAAPLKGQPGNYQLKAAGPEGVRLLGIGRDAGAIIRQDGGVNWLARERYSARARRIGTELLRRVDSRAATRLRLGGPRIGGPVGLTVGPRHQVYVATQSGRQRFRHDGRDGAPVAITRLRADGSVDRGFGRDGTVVINGRTRPYLYGALLIPDPAARRLWVLSDLGDALAGLREDFGKDRIFIASIRVR